MRQNISLCQKEMCLKKVCIKNQQVVAIISLIKQQVQHIKGI